MKVFNSAVIGLGNIGAGYDYAYQEGERILTHAAGFRYHKQYKLVGGVDPDKEKRGKFTKKYGVKAFSTIRELYDNLSCEVISIAVSTHLHYEVFCEVIAHKPIAVLCEKPISNDLHKATQMVDIAHKANCILAVNYMRRCDPGVARLKKLITSGRYGKFYKGFVWYSKGLLNNGSHYLDLLNFLFGSVRNVRLINRGHKWNNLDPEPDFQIQFDDCMIYFSAVKEEYYTLGEIELIGTKGKIRYASEGKLIECWGCQNDTEFEGYTILKNTPLVINTGMHRYEWYVLQNLAKFIQGESKILLSSGESALETLAIIERILRLRGKSGRKVSYFRRS